jgi:hypothetical protein
MAGGVHESFEDHGEVDGPSDRSFGLTVGGILVAIGLVRYFAFGAGLTSTLAISIPGLLLVLSGLAAPGLLGPLNRLWMRLGLLLASIVNPIILFLMYALIFVPVGLAMRLFGRDALRFKPDREAASYWIVRDPPGPEPQTMNNQF